MPRRFRGNFGGYFEWTRDGVRFFHDSGGEGFVAYEQRSLEWLVSNREEIAPSYEERLFLLHILKELREENRAVKAKLSKVLELP